MSFFGYGNISAAQKNDVYDGNQFQQTIQNHNDNNTTKRASSSLKRHSTNHSQINEDQSDDEIQEESMESQQRNNNDNFQQVTHSKNRKKKFMNDKDDRVHARIINNSNINNHKNIHTTASSINTNNNSLTISKHALDYASEYHHVPIKIECEPKINDQREGARFIQAFLNYIKEDFLKENKTFNKPVLFDLWWIDKDGNLQVISKSAEIIVYLSQQKRYPKELNNIKIISHPPKHLPPQFTAILKWVKNSISFDDIKEEINAKFKSIYLIEEIIRTINDRNRHIRIELSEKQEYISMLNSGKISIFGNSYDVDEYLPSPKILICSKCNQPGHIRKNCQTSRFDICKRCGGDRTNAEEHKNCTIQCHHCKGDHTAIDFKCPFIQEYRRRLIIELRNRPDLLPPGVQLFIPTDFREQGERTKVIRNKSAENHLQQMEKQLIYERNDIRAWPQMPSKYTNLADSVKELDNELQTLKKNFEDEQNKIEQKYKQQQNIVKQSWLIIQQQMETHTQIITTINNAINQTLFFTCQKTINTMVNVINKIKTQANTNEFDVTLNELSTYTTFINDTQTSYIKHQRSLESLIIKQKEAIGSALQLLSENHE
ncbi:unnamed protein product [Adineta steineri]|uniref:CCHC-type domain-containing protein n=1 Tax=Adineta steineri TaxID=433720 RepID=A0A818UPC9_9BILA|nr:unnamed protein product [Adineta steineri]CAF3701474.1 unnamed protein product [Adineta steineri]